tara:strand:- start:2832 stop:3662 length:831 start_codon:yes stop_codon:yes gene_type:complete
VSWLDKLKVGIGKKSPEAKTDWIECPKCNHNTLEIDLAQNLRVCPQCNYHHRLNAMERILLIIDAGSFSEFDHNLTSADPLKFRDKKKYKERIKSSLKKGLTTDAIVCGSAKIFGRDIQICTFEFGFMGGSMGAVVGEKITRAIERAIDKKNPLIIFSCSGGARMQEGIFSLMQMAKTSSALNNLAKNKLPFISVLTDPTMGGVSASFSMLGDVILAEPGALIGFAGPRVIEQTIQQKLPDGFQTSEFLLNHGLIDNVVTRKELRLTIDKVLNLLY